MFHMKPLKFHRARKAMRRGSNRRAEGRAMFHVKHGPAKITGFSGDFGAGAPVVCQRLFSAMVQINI